MCNRTIALHAKTHSFTQPTQRHEMIARNAPVILFTLDLAERVSLVCCCRSLLLWYKAVAVNLCIRILTSLSLVSLWSFSSLDSTQDNSSLYNI
jgi:hypothetical protein